MHLQFSDSVDASGSPFAQIGTTSSHEVVLQAGTGAPEQGWGWADNGWGVLGANIYFATSGVHIVRLQQREDGAIIDEIVLSPDTYLSQPPGSRLNDTTILPENTGH